MESAVVEAAQIRYSEYLEVGPRCRWAVALYISNLVLVARYGQ